MFENNKFSVVEKNVFAMVSFKQISISDKNLTIPTNRGIPVCICDCFYLRSLFIVLGSIGNVAHMYIDICIVY